jgi:hypothetical protein
MSALSNQNLALTLDVQLGLKVPTALSACTTNSTTTVAVTGSTTNIPAAGYVSGAGIPAGATYTLAGSTVTLSAAATASASGVTLTFSLYPCTLYYALFTVPPNASGGGTEVSGGSYARVAVPNNSTNFPATSANNKQNSTAITFPASTAAWGTVVAWGAYDAPAGGNLWLYGAISPSLALNSGDTATFAVGQFDLTF